MTSPSRLETEIHEQPDVLRRFLADSQASVRGIVAQLKALAPSYVVIAARGTSDNAATYAKYMFGALNGLPVALAAPSLHTLYGRPPNMRGSLVVGISQSGKGADVRAVLETAREQGAFSVAITNAADSPLAEAAHETLLLNAGPETSVAASKTYTTQLTAIAMLAAAWNGAPQLQQDLSQLADWAAAALQQKAAAAAIAGRLGNTSEMLVIGRGYNYATAHEIALKIKELTYVLADGYSAADFRHGPIALVEKDRPIVLIAPQGEALADMAALLGELHERGGQDVTVLTNDPALLARATSSLALPAGLPEWLSPIIGVIPGQLLALQIALAKGYDPDKPRGLQKVTSTR